MPLKGRNIFSIYIYFFNDKTEAAVEKGKESANVFDILMNVQKAYNKLPSSRKVQLGYELNVLF